jgi:hypothetical protein
MLSKASYSYDAAHVVESVIQKGLETSKTASDNVLPLATFSHFLLVGHCAILNGHIKIDDYLDVAYHLRTLD